jgi:hypothetical protein
MIYQLMWIDQRRRIGVPKGIGYGSERMIRIESLADDEFFEFAGQLLYNANRAVAFDEKVRIVTVCLRCMS